jgi:hypothetical protein
MKEERQRMAIGDQWCRKPKVEKDVFVDGAVRLYVWLCSIMATN